MNIGTLSDLIYFSKQLKKPVTYNKINPAAAINNRTYRFTTKQKIVLLSGSAVYVEDFPWLNTTAAPFQQRAYWLESLWFPKNQDPLRYLPRYQWHHSFSTLLSTDCQFSKWWWAKLESQDMVHCTSRYHRGSATALSTLVFRKPTRSKRNYYCPSC